MAIKSEPDTDIALYIWHKPCVIEATFVEKNIPIKSKEKEIPKPMVVI